MTQAKKERRPVGRPVEKPMPERIDASPEEIAQAVLKMPNKRRWRYLGNSEEDTR